MSKLISVVIPIYNEARTVGQLLNELQFISKSHQYVWEFIIVDDGSSDDSLKIIKRFIEDDSRIICIALTRNFGKEVAVTAGIDHAKGDAVVIIDADLQHPPAIIMEFIKKWGEGYLVVRGVRSMRQQDGFIRKISARFFYEIMTRLSREKQYNEDATDFCLIDKAVVSEFLRLKEHRRLNRALIDWLGFSSVDVEFVVADRLDGEARYTLKKLIKTAVGAIVSNSQVPLTLAGYLGIFITTLSGFLGVFIIIEQIIFNDPFKLNASASAMMAVFILFLNGIVLTCLGLMSLYIGSIQEEVLSRPLYVVGNRFNFSLNDGQKSEILTKS
jgi:glycosyltransferase involved in cell wall biosynthesis